MCVFGGSVCVCVCVCVCGEGLSLCVCSCVCVFGGSVTEALIGGEVEVCVERDGNGLTSEGLRCMLDRPATRATLQAWSVPAKLEVT